MNLTLTEDELIDAMDEAFHDNDWERFAEMDRQWHVLCAEDRAAGRGQPNIKATLEAQGIIGVTPALLPIRRIDKVQCGLEGEVCVIGVANRISPRDLNEPIYVAKRGRLLPPPTRKLHLFLRDDYDEILCIVDRFAFTRLGLPVIERGRKKKAVYAVKGTVPRDFRMISVTNIRYLGDLDSGRWAGRVGVLPEGEMIWPRGRPQN
jgi:hypothetical protein